MVWTPPPGFTGYRVDLEPIDRDLTKQYSSFYEPLMMGDWQTIDFFKWFRIRNQANMNSCRGHSAEAVHRACYYFQNGLPDLDQDGVANEAFQDEFSPMWFYLIAQEANNIRTDSGATIGGGLRKYMEMGGCRETVFPYPNPVRYSRTIPAAAKSDAANFKIKRYSRFEGANDAKKVFDWLGSGQGAVDWGCVWPLPFIEGCLVKSVPRAARGGGHATAPVCLMRGDEVIRNVPSLKRHLKEDEHVAVVANSHSERAQHKGYYFVTMEGVADILEHSWTEAVGVSDLATPEPRKIDWLKQDILG